MTWLGGQIDRASCGGGGGVTAVGDLWRALRSHSTQARKTHGKKAAKSQDDERRVQCTVGSLKVRLGTANANWDIDHAGRKRVQKTDQTVHSAQMLHVGSQADAMKSALKGAKAHAAEAKSSIVESDIGRCHNEVLECLRPLIFDLLSLSNLSVPIHSIPFHSES